MTLILKQSTSIDIRVGPFVDATDGVTPETGVSLGSADQAEVLKANGASTVAMGGTFAAVSGADGWYDYTVASGDVDTVGEVVFVVQDSSVCLPVFTRATVVEENVYVAWYAASAAAGTDLAAVLADTNELQSDDIPGKIVTLDAVVDTVKVDTAAILVDTNELQGDWANGGRLDLLIDATLADTNELQGDWANGGRLDLLIDAILLDTGTTLDGKLDTIDNFLDTEIAAIKAKTDSLTFTSGTDLDANVQKVNDIVVTGDGESGTEWGPA